MFGATHPKAHHHNKGLGYLLLRLQAKELHIPGQLLCQNVVFVEIGHASALYVMLLVMRGVPDLMQTLPLQCWVPLPSVTALIEVQRCSTQSCTRSKSCGSVGVYHGRGMQLPC